MEQPRFSRIIIRDSSGRILMTVSVGGVWNFPGGKVTIGESPADAAVREVLEETGILVDAAGLVLVCQGEYKLDQVTWKGFYFEANAYTGKPRNQEPDIHSKVGFFEIDDIQVNGSKKFVLDALAHLSLIPSAIAP